MSNSTLMNKYVTDTMGLVLRLEHRKLGQQAKKIFEIAEQGDTSIYIPSIVFAEILYLSEKRRIAISLNDVDSYLNRYEQIQELPMTFAVMQEVASIADIPELHDRIIAGSARYMNLQLITNDPVIQSSSYVDTLW